MRRIGHREHTGQYRSPVGENEPWLNVSKSGYYDIDNVETKEEQDNRYEDGYGATLED